MMKVVGEEGTSVGEFVDYLKGDFYDAVYLQQNAFDKTDESTSAERQVYVFDLINEILDQEFEFGNKSEARRYFQELRQIFLSWNSMEFGKEEFKSNEKQIREKLNQKAAAAAK